MAIVDAQGRLWGRWNLLDAVVVVFVVALVPLVYGAYALFRTPPPSLVALGPAVVESGAPNLRVRIQGVNLRPFLRVSFDTYQGRTFLFMDSTKAEVELNDMPPGVYDVVLYDNMQERSRLPKALAVLAPAKPLPTIDVIVVGRFLSLTAAQAKQITTEMTIVGGAGVLEVGRAVPATPKVFVGGPLMDLSVPDRMQVPVTVRLGCDLQAANGHPECHALRIPLRPAYIGVVSTSLGDLSFQVDQLTGSQLPENIQVVVRLNGPIGVLSQIRAGDTDVALAENELVAGARVAAVAPLETTGPDSASRLLTFRLRSQRAAAGWTYLAMPVRLGGSFAFRAPRYEVAGSVLAITPVGPSGPEIRR